MSDKKMDGCALPAQLYPTEASASCKKTQAELDAKLKDDDDVFAALVREATEKKDAK